MGSTLLLQYYSIYFYSIFVLFVSRVLSYSTFVLLIACVSALFMLARIFIYGAFNPLVLFTAVAGVILVGVYYIGMRIRGSNDPLEHTFFLVLLGQTFPAALASTIYTSRSIRKKSVNRLLAAFILLFTMLILFAVLRPNAYAGGGGLTTEFVLNYQNGSYLCAYISNFIMYLFVVRNRKKRIKIGLIGLFVLISFCMLILGGKGGFVTYLGVNGILVLWYLRKKGISGTVIVRNTAIALAVLILGFFVIRRASNVELGGNAGFTRILGFINNLNDSGRGNIYKASLELFLESPLFGQGLGSIFGNIGTHSHNLFINALAETGLVGTSLLLWLLVNSIKKCIALIRMNPDHWIIGIIFLDGFFISMFSGYYLAQVLLFSGLLLIQGRYRFVRKEGLDLGINLLY